MQRLRTDDRIAFPFGCGTDSAGAGGTTYFDRFCANGNFDLYDFRSEDESRRSSTLDVTLHGAAATGALAHEFSLGLQRTIVKNRFQADAFNFAGTGNIDGTLVVPPAPDAISPQTNRDERSSEIALRDAIAFGSSGATAWLGARHTQLDRSATPTDGSPGTAFKQSFTTPFVALSQVLGRGQLVYASWGKGVESDVAPRAARPLGRAAGAALPQRRPGTPGGREPAGRGRRQGRRRARRVERGGVRHPPPALR
jgi:iron complex outermembrane receptor protein